MCIGGIITQGSIGNVELFVTSALCLAKKIMKVNN